MRYTRKNEKLEDYFEGEELEIIKRELEVADEEIARGEKMYSLEEVIDHFDIKKEEKEKILKQINKHTENIRKKYIDKCKSIIKKHHIIKYDEEIKQYIS